MAKQNEVASSFDFSEIKNPDIRQKVHLGTQQILAAKNRAAAEIIRICKITEDMHGLMEDKKTFYRWAGSLGWSRGYATRLVRISRRLGNVDGEVLDRFSYNAVMLIASSSTVDDQDLERAIALAKSGESITVDVIKPRDKPKPPAPPKEPPLPPKPVATAASPPTDETGQDDAESGSDKENRKEPAAGVSHTEAKDEGSGEKPPPGDDDEWGDVETHQDDGEEFGLHQDDAPGRDLMSLTVLEKIELDNKDLESFCRKLIKAFDDGVPDQPWLQDKGRIFQARSAIASACATIRSAKQVCCPACCPQGDVEPDENCHWCKGYGGLPKVLADTIHL